LGLGTQGKIKWEVPYFGVLVKKAPPAAIEHTMRTDNGGLMAINSFAFAVGKR